MQSDKRCGGKVGPFLELNRCKMRLHRLKAVARATLPTSSRLLLRKLAIRAEQWALSPSPLGSLTMADLHRFPQLDVLILFHRLCFSTAGASCWVFVCDSRRKLGLEIACLTFPGKRQEYFVRFWARGLPDSTQRNCSLGKDKTSTVSKQAPSVSHF